MSRIVYLECREDNHNKFYLMTEDPTGTTFVARWGRIGYATVAEKANVKEGTLVEGNTYYIQS